MKKKAPVLRTFYPEIEPYKHGMLDVGDGHRIYWEACGNPKGKPAVFLHGGPGGGCGINHRRLFNPKKYNIILFDQRGCGRSKPYACLEANTTPHLVSDIEKLRKFLGIERWLVLGGSWGSTLALAYAEKHTDRVTELVLRGIFAVRKKEIDWFYQEGASFLFPDLWENFLKPLSKAERKDIVSSYARRLASKNKRVRMEAALAWAGWEYKMSTLLTRQDTRSRVEKIKHDMALSVIENHYFMNNGFMKEGELLKKASKLKGIPGVIIQGRYDVVCPATTAWELHKNWPSSTLVMIPDAGHTFNEPGTLDATIFATDAFAARRG